MARESDCLVVTCALTPATRHLIDARIFVALVTMAIATSVLAGPMMKRLLYGPYEATRSQRRSDAPDQAADLVRAGAFVPRLVARTSARAIEELGHALRASLGDLVEPALIAVLERELVAPTGLGDEVAIPHAPIEGLSRPVVALGLSKEGIDFDAPDGRASHIIFLLLLPPKAFEREVRVLACLARSVFDEAARDALLATTTADEAFRCLDEHTQRIERETQAAGSRLASFAEM